MLAASCNYSAADANMKTGYCSLLSSSCLSSLIVLGRMKVNKKSKSRGSMSSPEDGLRKGSGEDYGFKVSQC